MLKEISCPYFKTGGHASNNIQFHKGLNVILGASNGATSIGKSTALLIIDFAFGGSAYAGSNAVSHLGSHSINFTFEFDHPYQFSRDTARPNEVVQHQADGSTTTMPLQDFTSWLATQYKLNYEKLTFRSIISRFFRIYGKNNYDEKHPLQSMQSESQAKAIDVLVALSGYYEQMLPLRELLQAVKEKSKAFQAARKYQFVPSAVTKESTYKENLQKISDLNEKKFQLESQSNGAINDSELKKANLIDELQHKLYEARLRLQEKERRLHRINLNLRLGVRPTEADLDTLATFFPHVNLEKLTNIEQFHNKIQAILRDELEAAKTEVERELPPLRNDVLQIQKQIESITPSMAYSKEFLTAYSRIDRKIHQLEDENKIYLQGKEIAEEKKRTTAYCEENSQILLHKIEKSVNDKMEEISDFISEGKNISPIMRLLSNNKYTFETPNDTGTGTNYRGMLTYDFSLLKITKLPAIAHDSLLFPHISDENLSKIIELYASEKEKQIFIAFDRYNNYGDHAAKLLKEHTVLTLDSGSQALFGSQWGTKNDSER
ncbi:MAG: DUF2326 domain-containing protein [Fibrobacter sp.]|nr:DUF2326 domain-containing protein [Fibrobacter sp.]